MARKIILTGARMRETGRERVQVPWPEDAGPPDIDTAPETMPRCGLGEVWNPHVKRCVPKIEKERPLAGESPGLFARLRRMIVPR